MTALRHRGMGEDPTQICISTSPDGQCSGSGGAIVGTGAGEGGGTYSGLQSYWSLLLGEGGTGQGAGAGLLPFSTESSAVLGMSWVTLALFGAAVFIAYKIAVKR